MNLDQAWGYVSVLADISLAKKVSISTEDDQIICNEYGVFLTPTKIDRKSIRGKIQVDGWAVETGGQVSSSRYDELDDYEINEIGCYESFNKAAEVFVSTIFSCQVKQLIEMEKIVVNDNGAEYQATKATKV